MLNVTVKDNVKEFTKHLNHIQKKQIPFATSKAINDTAVKAQESIVRGIMLRFINRKKWWVRGNRRTGIRVEFSSKKKLPIHAKVYTNAYFADTQEDGGIKSPKSGKALAVPTDRAPKSAKRSDGIHRVKNRKNVFVSKKGVFQRVGKKRLKTLFTWTRTASITPRLKFISTAKATTKRWFPIYFKKRLEEALRAAK